MAYNTMFVFLGVKMKSILKFIFYRSWWLPYRLLGQIIADIKFCYRIWLSENEQAHPTDRLTPAADRNVINQNERFL